MDPYNLLINNLPFDENKLQILDQALSVFYFTKINSERKEAEQVLNEFKLLPDSWKFCEMILNKSQSIYTKFFALLIIEDIIRSQWNVLTNDQKLRLKNCLFDILLKNINDEKFQTDNQALINKLNLNIIMIVIQESGTILSNFIDEICRSNKLNWNLCENNLKLLSMLKDEVHNFWKNSMTKIKANELKIIISKDLSLIIEFCSYFIENENHDKISLLKNAIRMFSDYSDWFPIEFVFKESILSKLLNNLIQKSNVLLDVITCMTNIFSLTIDLTKIDTDQNFKIKEFTFKIFKSFVKKMNLITNMVNLSDEYNRITLEEKSNFEGLCLQFVLSLIAFFKNNMNFLEEYDFIQGSEQPSEFLLTYLNEIEQGLTYICQINHIPNEEIFRACAEFWNWFCFKICYLKEKNRDYEEISLCLQKESSRNEKISFTSKLYLYQHLYIKILENLRQILITKMTKPDDLKISVKETDKIIGDEKSNSSFLSLYENLRECWIYLTHLDPTLTNNLMLESLQVQTAEHIWNPNLLNSICWSIGSIAGSMDESHDYKFFVIVIKV